jgi:hypothetical protein
VTELEQPPPGVAIDPPQVAPVNQAQGCFRVLLWLMPSGFAAISAWTIDNYNLNVDSLLMLWIGMNLVFWGITGWFNAIMSSPVRALEPGKRTGMIIWLTVAFALLQLVLIPLIAVFLVFAFCAFVAR